MIYDFEEVERVASQIRAPLKPQVGIITGSGLSGLADEVEEPLVIPYEEIPDFPPATVEGHPGRMVLGYLAGKAVVVMQGRAHFYEGYPLERITLPVRVMRALGADTLIVTNAAGGLNEGFKAGDLMLITDHINLVGMAGDSPLFGPNDERLGPRFVDMSEAYDRELRKIALEVGHELGLELRQGVYVMVGGPTFETPAEIRFLRLMGVDAVGMSTVPEVVVARHGGMRVLGISHISNMAVLTGSPGMGHPVKKEEGLHEEVLEAGEKALPKLLALIKGVLGRI
ncbi:MAG TPA: purine-nucleoside phosphorylase [Chloroflexi bacterium]|nr:purine-nucleoside phosphorylase [Chloroflexota bacterium]